MLDFLRLEDADGGDPRYGALTPAQWACFAMVAFALGLAAKLLHEQRTQIGGSRLAG
jgi:phosphatidylglycerol:prolipoprotein diacylglycerol transferase